MSNFSFNFGDATHLSRFAIASPKPEFVGAWTTVELQPDVFVPQRFTIGIVVQSPGDRLHFKLLADSKKFDALYRDAFPQRLIREILAHAEATLRRAVQEKTSLPEVRFDTDCLMLDTPRFTSGMDRESTVDRLFSEVVVMAPTERKSSDGFESIDTPRAREIVDNELKKIAQMDFDRIATQQNQGVLLEFEGQKHYLDLNLETPSSCGSVTSAVYKTAQSVEMNLLKSSRDLTTYSRIRNIEDIGLFLLLPEPISIEPKEYKHIESVIHEYEWKLERDGFRVVSLPSATELAKEIYDWAKPALI
ncbi:MAG: hypothetical protein QM702_08170 [Rubrivivax sp.]